MLMAAVLHVLHVMQYITQGRLKPVLAKICEFFGAHTFCTLLLYCKHSDEPVYSTCTLVMAELTKVVPNACLRVANAQITDNANLLMFLVILNFSHK
jgi:hypothetical protein